MAFAALNPFPGIEATYPRNGSAFFHDTHEFVAHHHRAHLRDSAGIHMQIGAADGRGGNF